MRVILSVLAAAVCVNAFTWDYTKENQKEWGEYDNFPYCAGNDQDGDDRVFINSQSPIKIPTKKGKFQMYRKNKFLPNIDEFEGNTIEPSVNLVNTGRYASLSGFNNTVVLGPTGLIRASYVIDHVDFKWPAEHKLGSKQADLEVQVFFTRQESCGGMGTQKVAMVQLYDHDDDSDDKVKDPNSFKDVLDALYKIPDNQDSTPIPNFDFTDLFHEKIYKQFYTYEGSITTPPCDESVTWIIGSKLETLSTGQFKGFKELLDVEGLEMKEANRKTHILGSRVVFNSFDDGKDNEENIFDQIADMQANPAGAGI